MIRMKRGKEIRKGLDMAVAAADIFDKAQPEYPKDHLHHRVVSVKKLHRVLRPSHRTALKLTVDEVDALKRVLTAVLDDSDEKQTYTISFSVFCDLLHQILSSRPTEVASVRQVTPASQPMMKGDIERGEGTALTRKKSV